MNDFLKKLERAKGIHGTRFIHVIAPCPTGWGAPESKMVDLARDVVDCGLWYLAEYEGEQESGVPRWEVLAQPQAPRVHKRARLPEEPRTLPCS